MLRSDIPDSGLRLRLATRIHFALLRRYGEDIPVIHLLARRGQAQEALWVCAASDDPELRALAARLEEAQRAAEEGAPTQHGALDSQWAASPSMFGVPLPPGHQADSSRSSSPPSAT